jgi:S1-C subfamily serine protease
MSVRQLIVGALTLASAGPALGSLAAQERQPLPRKRVVIEGESPELIRDRIRLITQRRARLGLSVDMRASDGDSIGATIVSVTPGGPAAKAGIRSGDIVTRLDGKPLVTTDNTKAGEDESLPGLRLVELASQLKAHDTISVEYRRGEVKRTASLVTGDELMNAFEFPEAFGLGVERGGRAWTMLPEKMRLEGTGKFEFGPGATGFAYAFGGPLMDLELAPINPDLGQYFGATEGVLVINVPKESTLGLKGGDVILSIDGRKATGPASLLRILRSYDGGDSFKLEIMRNKSRTTVTGKLEKKEEE